MALETHRTVYFDQEITVSPIELTNKSIRMPGPIYIYLSARVQNSIESLCNELLKCVEPGDFAIGSTLQQFKSYVDY